MSCSANSLQKKYGFENPFKADPLLKKAMQHIDGGSKLLDVGCGEGADSIFFAKQGFQVVGVDNNEQHLSRLQAYITDHQLSNISIRNSDVITYRYPKNYYDVINCLLVGCCMRRSEFEKMAESVKKAVKLKGIIIMSLRNHLDIKIEMEQGSILTNEIEPNTYLKNGDCCSIRYYIEKDRLRNIFKNFEILYYYEGLAPDKYEKVPEHGDSYIICRKIVE